MTGILFDELLKRNRYRLPRQEFSSAGLPEEKSGQATMTRILVGGLPEEKSGQATMTGILFGGLLKRNRDRLR